MEKTLEGLNRRLEGEEEWVSDLEDRVVEVSQLK